MSFREPVFLAGLALIPLAVMVYVALQRRRRDAAAAFANPDLLPNVVTGTPGWRRHVPAALALTALAALVLAVARPERTVAQPKRQATVMLVTDISGSMRATDVEPDRLAAAEDAAVTFAGKVPDTFRLGLVAFNDYAELRVPPTDDRQLLTGSIRQLEADGGTAMGDGLEQAVDAIRAGRQGTQGEASAAAIVLLSDGANSAGDTDPVDAAREARELGVPIYAVALGTPEGTITLQDQFGFDREIAVPPDPETLRTVAQTSGGRVFSAVDAGQLDSIYETLGTRIGFEEEQQEITSAFAGGGLLLLLIGGALGLRWFGRPV